MRHMRSVALLGMLAMAASVPGVSSSMATGGPRTPEDWERARRERELGAEARIAAAQAKRERRRRRNLKQTEGEP
jgi:hypothetical protein